MSSHLFNRDVLSAIVAHISNAGTLHTLLQAIPPTSPIFALTLYRLCLLPIHLSCDRKSREASHAILDYLLQETPSDEPSSSQPPKLVHKIRHLVICLKPSYRQELVPPTWEEARALLDRLPALFKQTRNLQTLKWFNAPLPTRVHLEALNGLENLRHLTICCAQPKYRCDSDNETEEQPADHEDIDQLDTLEYVVHL